MRVEGVLEAVRSHRNPHLCRVLNTLSSECQRKTLGKGFFAECQKTLGKDLLCRVLFLTLGKEDSLPSVFF